MRLNSYRIIVLVLILTLLSACQGQNELGAEQAAARQIVNGQSPDTVNDPQSIEMKQVQAFEDSRFVVLTYRRMWNSRDENCLAIYETHYEFLRGWTAGSGSASCTAREDQAQAANEPLHLFGGTIFRSEEKKPEISYVLGRVNDPAIVKVLVTWQDGQRQEAQVVEGSFLAIRSGDVQLKLAVGLDEANRTVDSVSR